MPQAVPEQGMLHLWKLQTSDQEVPCKRWTNLPFTDTFDKEQMTLTKCIALLDKPDWALAVREQSWNAYYMVMANISK